MRSLLKCLICFALVVALLMASSAMVFADPPEYKPILSKCETYLYYIDEDGGCSLFFYTGDDGEIVIPPAIDGYPVTAIGSAFAWADYPTMYLPSSVRQLSSNVFTSSDFQTLYLTGDAPVFHDGTFGRQRPLTVMFPAGNNTYTQELFDRFPWITWKPYQPEHEFIDGKCSQCGAAAPGDVNGDGTQNCGDVALLYNHCRATDLLMGHARLCGDVNLDGAVNIVDVAQLYATVKAGC